MMDKELTLIKGVHGYPFHVFFGGSRDRVVWPYFFFLVFFDKFGHQLFIERTHKTVVSKSAVLHPYHSLNHRYA